MCSSLSIGGSFPSWTVTRSLPMTFPRSPNPWCGPQGVSPAGTCFTSWYLALLSPAQPPLLDPFIRFYLSACYTFSLQNIILCLGIPVQAADLVPGSLPGFLQVGLIFSLYSSVLVITWWYLSLREYRQVLILWCCGFSLSVAGMLVRLWGHIDLISKPTLYLPGSFGKDI